MAPTTDPDRPRSRQRVAIGCVVLTALATLVTLVVVVPNRSSPTAPPTTSAAPTTALPPSTAPATTAEPVPHPPYPVGILTVTVTEPATGGAPARTFPTDVRFPARAGAGATGAPPDTPLRAPGRFPLVVFSGGFAVSPEEYSVLLDRWAAAGFVVADPVYPFTSPSPTLALDEGDIVHHPGDLSAVITTLLDADAGTTTGPGAALAGTIDPDRIAAIGHSDGGDVTLAAVADSCCHDPRIGAAVILSGAESTAFGGTYFATTPAVPLLVVQGTADDINPPGCSVQLYDQAVAPKYYLSLDDQSHQGPYLEAGPARDTVQQVVVDFLLGTVERSGPALAAMHRDGDVPGSSSLTLSAPTGLAAGSCPGAPAG